MAEVASTERPAHGCSSPSAAGFEGGVGHFLTSRVGRLAFEPVRIRPIGSSLGVRGRATHLVCAS
eukprot:2539219-Prymnesium_polylepis.1